MGTSASSSGPGSGVPLVPPWVSNPDTPILNPSDDDESPDGVDSEDSPNAPPQLAPMGRFRRARTNLGEFASSGSEYSLGQGIGHYVQTGLGGSRNASRRMAGTARRAGALYGVLHALSSGTASTVDLGLDPVGLAGHPAREVVDHIAGALSPSDGSLDSEASRHSISQALCELIQREPTLDLAALTHDQIVSAMELFVSADICRRIEVDVGKTILDRSPDAVTAVRRLEQMYRYVRQVVASSFRRRATSTAPLTQRAATRLASSVIQDTVEVFESYLS